jgi:site-specific recombinase XerD
VFRERVYARKGIHAENRKHARPEEKGSFIAEQRRSESMGFTLSAGYAEIYEEYLDYQRDRVTRLGYENLRRSVLHVLKWFEQEEIPLCGAAVQDGLCFRQSEAGRVKADGKPVSVLTLIHHLNTARALFRYLAETERIKSSPFEEVENPRRERHLSRNYLTEAQMGRLLEELGKFDSPAEARQCFQCYRVHVICEFMYASGLRGTEAAGVTEKDVDVRQRLVYVREGKWGKSRMAFLSGYAADVLGLYISRARDTVLAPFVMDYGHTLFGVQREVLMKTVNRHLRDACRRLELPVITTHAFRHSLGTHLLHSGCDMRHIQAILGHESLRTTEIYTRVDTGEIRQAIDRFHPRGSPHIRKDAHEQ